MFFICTRTMLYSRLENHCASRLYPLVLCLCLWNMRIEVSCGYKACLTVERFLSDSDGFCIECDLKAHDGSFWRSSRLRREQGIRHHY